jgi:CRISPR-associated protein Csm1
MNERDAVALGALLHDIGKFWQRTGRERYLYEEFGKGEVGRHGLHALWSGLFFQQHVLPKLPDFGEAGLYAQFHHRPDWLQSADDPRKQKLTAIVQQADHLAAQFDRDNRPADDPRGSPAFDRLEAVTERIAATERGEQRRESNRANWYYPLTPLSLTDDVYPVEVADKNTHRQRLTSEYAVLWDAFIAEHNRLPAGDFRAYFDTLPALLHKYLWCIPSATYVDYPSISLYDHSRVTAALAVCLYDVQKEGIGSDGEFLLIEGDISGIQNFIYNPAFNGQELQDGMARRLRGRSFYLNLLLRTLADVLIGEMNLYAVNTLWATGGHFLILAPNTGSVRAALEASSRRIEQWMWREFRGSLGVIIAELAVGSGEISPKSFSAVRDRLGQRMAAGKLRQFAVPLGFTGAPDDAWESAWALRLGEGVCKDTGRDLSAEDLEISMRAQQGRDDQNEIHDRSVQSLLFDAIGRALIATKTLQLRRTDDWPDAGDTAHRPRNAAEAERLKHPKELFVGFEGLGRTWLLSRETTPRGSADLCLRIADHRNESIEFLPDATPQGTALGFEMLADAVKTVREKGGEKIVEFHELAAAAEGAGFLSVLRMDVDDLGYIFSQGLPKQERSISKIANLSRMMEWFFAGHLNTLVSGKNLYTTYAGGDDLFVVGAWNEVLDLAGEIRERFGRFCGGNPDLHISGGIALCKGKYPIGRAAEEAGDKLDGIAKSRARSWIAGDTEKDALAFLERKISWERWREVRALGDRMIAAYEEGKLTRKFIYHLTELYEQHLDPGRNPAKEQSDPDFVWLPKFLYSLVRNVKDKPLCIELQTAVEYQKHYLSILAGYVSLKTRSGRGGAAGNGDRG